jgi:hypothetical protein
VNLRFLGLWAVGLAVILLSAACAPQATETPVDAEATAVAQALSVLLTQTAGAASPTPPPATGTVTPSETPTPLSLPTGTPAHGFPITLNFAGCWFGPGPSFTLESNISKGKRVEVLGLGSVPGWYVIRNPYFHRPCWMEATNLHFDPGANTSNFPVMTPGP